MKICDTHAVVKKMFRPPTKSIDTTKQSLIFDNINKTTTVIEKMFNFFHERITMNNYKVHL